MNYIIEDDIDFYSELKKLNETSCINNSSTCLISGEKLDLNYIKLDCSHCFNYKPLLAEVINQKKNYNPAETLILSIDQIKCPYCRNITNGLLPQIPGLSKTYITGVNAPRKYCMPHRKCSWVFKSGVKKNTTCEKNGYDCNLGSYCNTHRNIIKRNLLKQENNIGNSPTLSKDTYNKLTVVDLRKQLREKGLKVSGNKIDLITRLKNST
jgi:hypothetical protein